MYIYTYVYTYMYIYTHIYMHIYSAVQMMLVLKVQHIYSILSNFRMINISIYTYIYMHIYMCTYTQCAYTRGR